MDEASFQTFVLVALRAAGDTGLSETRLLNDARREGFADLTLPVLQTTLRGFADRVWIHNYEQPVLGTRWRISSQGRSVLEEMRV